MSDVSVTKLSSRGQVVIPLELREEIGLKKGDSLAVAASKDTLVLKKIYKPTKEELLKEFDKLSMWGREYAKKIGVKNEKDVVRMIHKARGRK